MRVLIAAAIFGISFGNYGCSNEAKFAGRPMAAAGAPAAPVASPGAAIQTTADANAEVETPAVVNPPVVVVNPPAVVNPPVVNNPPAVVVNSPAVVNPPAVVSSPWLDVTAVGPNLTLQDTRTGLKWTNRRPDATWQGAINHCSALNYNGVTGWRLPTLEEFGGAANVSKIADAARSNWLTATDMNLQFWSVTSYEACCAYYPGFQAANGGPKSWVMPVVCVQ